MSNKTNCRQCFLQAQFMLYHKSNSLDPTKDEDLLSSVVIGKVLCKEPGIFIRD